MQLKPFFRNHRHQLYFASPETCLHYLRNDTLGEHDYVFVFNDWYVPDHPSGLDAYHRLLELDHARIRIMCNSERERSFVTAEIGFPEDCTLYCSRHFIHGSTASTRMFNVRNDVTPYYNAVLNARTRDYKNRWLAAGVDRLACIDFLAMPPELDCCYYNTRQLNHGEVADILQRSCVGLMLSFVEGASLASLEYLLCGLPVVSTASFGGRDAWYDHNNCIIVGPSIEAGLAGDFDKQALCREVREAVETWIERIDLGEVDAGKVRDSALAVNEKFCANFLTAVNNILTAEENNSSDAVSREFLDTLKPYSAYGAYLD